MLKISTVPLKPASSFAGPICEAKVDGLREGQAYQWQVRAVNKVSFRSLLSGLYGINISRLNYWPVV
jgi:hypothetical protein